VVLEDDLGSDTAQLTFHCRIPSLHHGAMRPDRRQDWNVF
jgi:hypothetical protein